MSLAFYLCLCRVHVRFLKRFYERSKRNINSLGFRGKCRQLKIVSSVKRFDRGFTGTNGIKQYKLPIIRTNSLEQVLQHSAEY